MLPPPLLSPQLGDPSSPLGVVQVFIAPSWCVITAALSPEATRAVHFCCCLFASAAQQNRIDVTGDCPRATTLSPSLSLTALRDGVDNIPYLLTEFCEIVSSAVRRYRLRADETCRASTEALLRMQRAFLHNISHELCDSRTPTPCDSIRFAPDSCLCPPRLSDCVFACSVIPVICPRPSASRCTDCLHPFLDQLLNVR